MSNTGGSPANYDPRTWRGPGPALQQTAEARCRELEDVLRVEREHYASLSTAVKTLQDQVKKLRKIIVLAAIPLEALIAGVQWELTKEIKDAANEALIEIHSVIAETERKKKNE